MAERKVSEMPQANEVNDSDLLMIVQGMINKKVTKQVLMEDVNSEISNLSDNTYTKTQTDTLLNNKVDKVTGKGLSTNDFTNEYKQQITTNQTAITNIKDGTTIDSFGDVETALNAKEDAANKVTSISSESTNTQYPSAKLLYDKLAEKQTEIDNLQTDVEDSRNASVKVTGTGTDITLNNTASARLLDIELKGNTSQATLEGRNLLNGTNPTGANYANATLNNNVLKISSTATNTTPFVRYEFNVSEGEIYRLNAIIKNTNGQIVVQKYSSSWESVVALTRNYIDGTSISSISYTVPSSVTMVRFLIYANNNVPSSASESNYENVIVTKDNADMTFEPYCRTEYQAPHQTFHNLLKM